MSDIKRCSKCGRELPLSRFYLRRVYYRRGDGTEVIEMRPVAWCKDCLNAHTTEKRRQRRNEGPELQERVKAYQADYYKRWIEHRRQERTHEVTCKQCGKTFKTHDLRIRYCSKACRSEHYREYRREYEKKRRADAK